MLSSTAPFAKLRTPYLLPARLLRLRTCLGLVRVFVVLAGAFTGRFWRKFDPASEIPMLEFQNHDPHLMPRNFQFGFYVVRRSSWRVTNGYLVKWLHTATGVEHPVKKCHRAAVANGTWAAGHASLRQRDFHTITPRRPPSQASSARRFRSVLRCQCFKTLCRS